MSMTRPAGHTPDDAAPDDAAPDDAARSDAPSEAARPEAAPSGHAGDGSAPWDSAAQLRAGMERLFGSISDAVFGRVVAGSHWTALRRGDCLFREGDPPAGVYFLAGGRLRAVREDGATERVLGDVAVGESVGEMAFFTREPRSATIYAVRDSVVAHLPDEICQRLLHTEPGMAVALARLVIDRDRRSRATTGAAPVTNIDVIPASPAVDARGFCLALTSALAEHGPALLLDADTVDQRFDSAGAARAEESDARAPGLVAWLVAQEESHRFVVYQSDAEPTPWSGRAVRHADHILIVGDAGGDPALAPVERELLGPLIPSVSAQRTLVLLHPADVALPAGTIRWLEPRQLDDHEHMRGQGADQFARLARILAGRAVGLVLGGGGARGFAHIGVVRALREIGFPIDLAGGTSMGGIIAAQTAMGWDHHEMIRRSRAAFVELGAQREYTLPVFSLLSGRKRPRMGEILYGDACIEDLWTEYFCVSTNLTRSAMRVHRRGSVARALAASTSLPGVVVPILDDGDLLVDGGVINNLPADVMRDIGAGVILTVDVSVEEDLALEGDDFPSPWSVLGGRILRRPVPRAPNILEILVRTTLLASAARARETRGAANFHLELPLAGFSLMDFEIIERVADIGYEHAMRQVEEWDGGLGWRHATGGLGRRRATGRGAADAG
jgi:predicted acylesterase/phospholipase RssA